MCDFLLQMAQKIKKMTNWYVNKKDRKMWEAEALFMTFNMVFIL